MKGLCYIVLILGFFIFFQQNPLYAVICMVIFLGVYILFKSRSSRSLGSVYRFLTGKNPQQESNIDDLITLMMIQQVVSSSNNHDYNQPTEDIKSNQQKNAYIDKIKKEVLDLLDDT
ncbi:MAG: hypothetical protein ACFFC3_14670 [Candidatus Odinarchaeota archaeon]